MGYTLISTKQKPIPVAISSQEIVTEFKAAYKNPKQDPSRLFMLLRPWFVHWKRLLLREIPPADINYITLCQRLEYRRGENALIVIDEWITNVVDIYERDLVEELEYIFLEFLRSLRFFPTSASPLMAEYVIARGFKEKLQAKIESVRGVEVIRVDPFKLEQVLIIDIEHPDHLLIKNMGLNSWETYLWDLVIAQHNTTSIANLCHIPRKTFEPEEKEIWKRLRELYHAEVI